MAQTWHVLRSKGFCGLQATKASSRNLTWVLAYFHLQPLKSPLLTAQVVSESLFVYISAFFIYFGQYFCVSMDFLRKASWGCSQVGLPSPVPIGPSSFRVVESMSHRFNVTFCTIEGEIAWDCENQYFKHIFSPISIDITTVTASLHMTAKRRFAMGLFRFTIPLIHWSGEAFSTSKPKCHNMT